MSSIEWTNKTWNPTSGCNEVGPGCERCYAKTMAHRLQAMGMPGYENGFALTLHPQRLGLPLTWKKPSRVFVNSMSDLFHKDVPDDFILRVIEVCRQASWHQFQILTKRSQRLGRIGKNIDWPENVWLGVSVEDQAHTFRIKHLLGVPAAIKFVSFEPLLGPISNLDLNGIDWAITGGESGSGARPSHPDWFREIRSICRRSGTAYFFKQFGNYAPVTETNRKSKTVWLRHNGETVPSHAAKKETDVELIRLTKKDAGRVLDGQTWDEYPVGLAAR